MPDKTPSVDLTRRDWAVPPGEMLQERLDELGMSQSHLARATGYSQKHVNRIAKGRARITAESALRLEAELGISARFWMHLQADHDLATARRHAR